MTWRDGTWRDVECSWRTPVDGSGSRVGVGVDAGVDVGDVEMTKHIYDEDDAAFWTEHVIRLWRRTFVTSFVTSYVTQVFVTWRDVTWRWFDDSAHFSMFRRLDVGMTQHSTLFICFTAGTNTFFSTFSTLLICRILNMSDPRIFWCYSDVQKNIRRMHYFPAQSGHRYPQGQIYKICLFTANLFTFRFSICFR